MDKAGSFDGFAGKAVGPLMAWMNRDAEFEAVRRLDPAIRDVVLVIGFGPGVGVNALAAAMPKGKIVGVDPSAEMLRQATHRNREPIASGRVTLHRMTAEQITGLDESFDGAIAVNTLQMCLPLIETARSLAMKMSEGAQFIAITHEWAVKKDHGDPDRWLSDCAATFEAAGFRTVDTARANAEDGKALLLTAVR